MSAELKKRAAAAKAWLLDSAFPLWAGAGFDAHTGLFHEKLDANAKPVAAPYRVRVQARQTYCFALAGQMGWNGPWKERVEAGFATLRGPANFAGGVGHLLDASGNLIDPRRDLYDQAFAIFGLAHAASALRSKEPIAVAANVMHSIESWRQPAGGFAEGAVEPPLPRRQNPHMHLFEACMAVMEVDSSPLWRDTAAEMADLFDTYFFDKQYGSLREFFADDFSPAPGDVGRTVEPGHHFEWVWLVNRWRELSGEDRSAQADRLYAHATANGIRGQVAVDECWIEGGVKSPTARLWPQTERLKAGLIRFERTGEDADALVAHDGLLLYLDKPAPGLWRDRMLEGGSLKDEPAPASSFYHIALALAELVRIADKA